MGLKHDLETLSGELFGVWVVRCRFSLGGQVDSLIDVDELIAAQ